MFLYNVMYMCVRTLLHSCALKITYVHTVATYVCLMILLDKYSDVFLLM